MKTKKFFNVCACVLLLGGLAMLTSCVYDSDEAVAGKTSEDGKLIININSTTVGTRATNLTTVAAATEKQVTSLVIGVFRPSDDATNPDALVEYKYLTGLSADISSGYETTAGVKRPDATYPARTLSVQVGDVVLAVCNVPADLAATLQTKTTGDAFRKAAFAIDQALIFNDNTTPYANSGTAEDPAKLPMYGEGTVLAHATITGAFTTSITVRHMVAKITLASLKLETTDPNVQFTPKQIFLTHVPEVADFYYSSYANLTYGYNQNAAKFYQGEADNDGSDDTKLYRDYLSTPALTGAALTQASGTYASTHILYTMPANPTNTSSTRLVVKGKWSTDGGTNEEDVYYPIKLYNSAPGNPGNEGIVPNAHYIISLVIKRAGSGDSETDLNSTQTASGSIQVTDDWSEQAVTTTFNSNGGDPVHTF